MDIFVHNQGTLFFSFRSPYAWILWEELNQQHPSFVRQVKWVPYWEPAPWLAEVLNSQLVPITYQPMSRNKSFYVLEDVKRRSQALGLAVRWPVDRAPAWEYSHLAYLEAMGCGTDQELLGDFFRARWMQGRDLHDPAVVEGIVHESGGADVSRLRWVEGTDLTSQAVAVFRYAAAQRIFGVPYLVSGHSHFFGVDSIMRRVVSGHPTVTSAGRVPSELAAFGDDPADGCG